MLAIRKKDKIKVISGDERGKTGEVIRVLPRKKLVLVSGVNLVKKHSRPRSGNPGGIHEIEAPIAISNVQLICKRCNQPTKVKFDRLADGKKIRVCRKCNEVIL